MASPLSRSRLSTMLADIGLTPELSKSYSDAELKRFEGFGMSTISRIRNEFGLFSSYLRNKRLSNLSTARGTVAPSDASMVRAQKAIQGLHSNGTVRAQSDAIPVPVVTQPTPAFSVTHEDVALKVYHSSPPIPENVSVLAMEMNCGAKLTVVNLSTSDSCGQVRLTYRSGRTAVLHFD